MSNCFLIVVLMFTAGSAVGQEATTSRQIQEALMPLPESLRDGATVVLDAVPGKRVVLRKGTNGLICRANTSKLMFNVFCHTQELDVFYTRFAQLTLEGKSNSEIRELLNAEVASGKLKSPPVGA